MGFREGNFSFGKELRKDLLIVFQLMFVCFSFTFVFVHVYICLFLFMLVLIISFMFVSISFIHVWFNSIHSCLVLLFWHLFIYLFIY